MMKTKEEAFNYIEEQEKTDIAYCKVGEGCKKLIVSFSSNQHWGFERKESIIEMKYENSEFDILYMRNRWHWYIGELSGIGTHLYETLDFLKKEFYKYDEVCCIGTSAGGYASILYGSLLCVDRVVAYEPQTDLEYLLENLPRTGKLGAEYIHLSENKNKFLDIWNSYCLLDNVINDNTKYFVYYKGDNNLKKRYQHGMDFYRHGDHHYNKIKKFSNVFKLSNFDWRDII